MGFWCFMLAMDLIIPLSMIFLGKYFSKRAPKEINMLFGYRTTRSTKNQDTWQFAHHFFGRLWYKMGLLLLILSVAAMLPGLGRGRYVGRHRLCSPASCDALGNYTDRARAETHL